MAKIRNTSSRSYTLPLRKGPDGKKLGGSGSAIAPGAVVDLPSWYLEELAAESSFVRLFTAGFLVDADAPKPKSAAERRLAEAAAELVAAKADAKQFEARAIELEKRERAALGRVKELEKELSALRASPPATPPATEPDTQS